MKIVFQFGTMRNIRHQFAIHLLYNEVSVKRGGDPGWVAELEPSILQNEVDASVLEIALAVGFNAKSSSNKVFKEESGQTPSEFRRDVRMQTGTTQ